MGSEEETDPPSYKDAFPPLPEKAVGSETHAEPAGAWSKIRPIRSSVITQVFHVPLEERKYKDMAQFREGEQAKICLDIMQKTGAQLELSLAKDQGLSIMVSGKLDSVMKARKEIVTRLQTQEPSGSTWRTSMELLQSYDLDVLKNDNVRLLTENEALTKRLGLMQENLELRCKLRDHECTVRSLTPSGKEHKEHNEPKAMDKKDEANVPPCRDPKQLKRCQRVVGEISLQLERRILVSIFLEPSRLYGYTVSNIQEKILQATTCPSTKEVDEFERAEMNRRFMDIMNRLKKYGYDPCVHPIFSEYLVNTYGGIMKDHVFGLPGHSKLVVYSDPEVMRKMAAEAMPAGMLKYVDVLLNCLINLAKEDGKPLFVWYQHL